jgi:hypothetical protein
VCVVGRAAIRTYGTAADSRAVVQEERSVKGNVKLPPPRGCCCCCWRHASAFRTVDARWHSYTRRSFARPLAEHFPLADGHPVARIISIRDKSISEIAARHTATPASLSWHRWRGGHRCFRIALQNSWWTTQDRARSMASRHQPTTT